MEHIKLLVEWSALGIELATVTMIVAASAFGTVRFLFQLHTGVEAAYNRFKTHLGKMLILSLEFLVAADIIKTVALEQTLNNVAILGLLVLIRTFLSWSLDVEIEGRWPWNKAGKKPEAQAASE
jgi:uncharacterized membrane protein